METSRTVRRWSDRSLPLALICVLSACTVGPNYVKPLRPRSPPAFKDVDGWKSAQPQDGVIRGSWWEVFEDPALNALEEQIEISNQDLAAAEARVSPGARTGPDRALELFSDRSPGAVGRAVS